MSVFNSASINNNFIKVRWQEPYTSAALNTKSFGIVPAGVYEGFTIGPGGLSGRDVIIGSGSVSGNIGSNIGAGYASGSYDSAIGYSIAVYQDPSGFNTTISIPPGPSSITHLDATGLDGKRVYVVAYVVYASGSQTSAYFALVDGPQIDANPWYIVLGYVDVPSNPATPLTGSMFGYADATYPRSSPQVTSTRSGLMTPSLLAQLQQNQGLPWNTSLVLDVDPNNSYNLTISPSQGSYSGKRYYTYILPNISSKFPRNSSGLYNGGSADNQLTYLNLLSGTIGGAHQVNTSFSTPSVSGSANAYQVGIIALDASDNISVTYGGVYGSLSGAMLDDNLPVVGKSLFQVGGFVAATNSSGALKPLSSTGGSVFWRRPYLNLGGSGSGSALTGAIPADGFQAILQDNFTENLTDSNSAVRSETNASYSYLNQAYTFSCDKSRTVTTSGTSYTLSGAPSFTVKAGDIIWIGAQSVFRRIVAVSTQTTGTLDAAFPVNASGAACMVSQALWTKDLCNYTQNYAAGDSYNSIFGATTQSQVNVFYRDSLAANDAIWDVSTTALLSVSASNSGLASDLVSLPTTDQFSSIFTRPTGASSISNYSLSSNINMQRLFLCFFPNPSNGSVTSSANLISYDVSYFPTSVLNNGGVLNSAFCFTDGSGTPSNCSNPTVVTVSQSLVGNETNLSNQLTGFSSTSTIEVGMSVTGTGIPASTTVTAIVSGSTIQISNNATATNSSVTFTFSKQVSQIVLGFNYLPTINSTLVDGDIEVKVGGLVFPKYIAGTTLDGYWTPVSGTTNTIQLHKNLSALNESIHITRRQGQIDSSSTNIQRLTGYYDYVVGSSSDVSAGKATHTSLQSAINALAGLGGRICILQSYSTVENIVISSTVQGVVVEGKGYFSRIQGSLTVSGAINSIRDLRVSGNITLSGNDNFLDGWIDSSYTLSSAGSGNSYNVISR